MATYHVQTNQPVQTWNYQSGPLDADPMDGVRGLKVKKGRRVGGLSAKKSHLTPFIGLGSSGPDR